MNIPSSSSIVSSVWSASCLSSASAASSSGPSAVRLQASAASGEAISTPTVKRTIGNFVSGTTARWSSARVVRLPAARWSASAPRTPGARWSAGASSSRAARRLNARALAAGAIPL